MPLMVKAQRARGGRLAEFIFALRQAKGKSLRQVAEASGVQFQAVAKMEIDGEGSPERVDKVIAGCGGGPRDLEDGRVMFALDRGVLPLPPDVDEGRLRKALRVVRGGA